MQHLVVSLKERYVSFFQSRPLIERTLLGAVMGLVLFPIPGIQILLLYAFPRLLYLLDKPFPWSRFFIHVWGFGFGFFLSSLYWICHALFIELDVFWWLVPFCFFGIPAFMALIVATISFWFLGWAYTVSSRMMQIIFLKFGDEQTRSVGRLLITSFWWVSTEYFLSSFCTGFPWSLVGYTWASIPVVAQSASLGSVYALSFLTLCVAGIPYLYYSSALSRFTHRYQYTACAIVFGLLLFGTMRLMMNPTEYTSTKIRLVQPSFSQSPQWKLEEHIANLHQLIRLSQEGEITPQLIIWPEGSFGFYVENKVLISKITQCIPKGGHLLLAAVRRDISGYKNWNSLYALNDQGDISAVYDKHHLVPFGEYVPLRSLLETVLPKQRIRKITSGLLDFSEGPGPRILTLKGIPAFSPIICYEAIFPGKVTPMAQRPEWLLQITNDEWFGASVGPYQHLQIARMRAIEEGLPLVRAANSGISAIIDPYGRIIKRLDSHHRGTLDGTLPKGLSSPPLSKLFFSIMGFLDQLDPLSSRQSP